jgi:hypothetical protein
VLGQSSSQLDPRYDEVFAECLITVGSSWVASVGARERVGQTQLNECLPSHADSLRFAVDCTKQIHRKVDIHTLDFTTGTGAFARSRCAVRSSPAPVHLVEASGSNRPSLRGNSESGTLSSIACSVLSVWNGPATRSISGCDDELDGKRNHQKRPQSHPSP